MKVCKVCKKEKEEFEFNKRKECRKCHSESVRQWKLRNKEKDKEHQKKWRKENKEKKNLITKIWQSLNLDKHRESSKRYYKNNPEKVKLANKAYEKKNPEVRRAIKFNRRAREENAEGSISSDDWIRLCNKYGNKCLCCGRSDVKLTLDHVIPLAKGGSNMIENAQPLCASCNSKKHTKIIDYRGEQ